MRILSWNIQWGRGTDGRVDLVRTADTIAGVDPDVICLQEVARHHPDLPGMDGNAPDQVRWLRERFGGCEGVFAAGSDHSDGAGGRRQFGEMILSRLPVLQVFRHLLPWPAESGTPSMQRVALEAVLAAPGLPGGALRVVTTHLEYYSAGQRRAQVGALRRIHAEGWHQARCARADAGVDAPFAVLPRGEGAVFCGDFNHPAGAPEHADLQAPFGGDDLGVPPLVDAWTIAHPGVPHAPTAALTPVDWLDAPACFDFFHAGADLTHRVRDVRVDAQCRASDHQPVILDLEIPS